METWRGRVISAGKAAGRLGVSSLLPGAATRTGESDMALVSGRGARSALLISLAAAGALAVWLMIRSRLLALARGSRGGNE